MHVRLTLTLANLNQLYVGSVILLTSDSGEVVMALAEQVLLAYGWEPLLGDILVAALSGRGWHVVGSPARHAELGEIGLVLVCGSRPAAVVVEDVWQARAKCPNAKIILMGGEVTDDEALAFIRAGAGAYIDTHQGLPELLNAMNMLRDNRSPACSRVTWLVLENIARLASKRSPDTNNSLTFREKQVLELVKKGMSNKEIADVLSIASNTVKNHIHHLLEKLNVRSRHEAAWVENHRPLRSAG